MRTAPRTASHSTRRALLGVAGVGLLLSLGGCGFHPLDARAPNAETSPELARIEVGPIPDRTGQVMRGELRHLLNPSGRDLPAAYVLSITYGTTSVSRGVRLDDSAVRIDITITATFTLSSTGKDDTPPRVLLKGQSVAVARKNNTYALYAAYTSEEETTNRAAKMTAEDIVRQVSLYFRYPDRYPAVIEAEPQKPVRDRTRPVRP